MLPVQDVKDSMIKELEDIQKNMKMPGCSVVTVGDTGAGKSTLLNALLGETNVLPTNGMRACTAAIIEMQFNKAEGGKSYVGEVEFVSKEDWEEDFKQVGAASVDGWRTRSCIHAWPNPYLEYFVTC